jgi:hypothetical protein
VIGDVNNYIAVTEDGKSKCKGRFEFADLALHKNKSFLVIPKALHAYFVDGIQPEDYLKSNRNIFDYCGGKKIKGDWKYVEKFIKNGVYTEKELQHTLRYYICNTGSKIIKINKSDGREINIEAGKWLQQIYINHIDDMDFDDYEINYKYYLENIRKEIEGLEPNINQLSLF